MDRLQKKQNVEMLNKYLTEAEVVVLTHYSGLTVQQMTNLRKRATKAGASFLVVKNKLAKIAAEGTVYSELAKRFVGPTAIAFSSDPVAAAKVVVEFAKDNEKLIILGGSILGQEMNPARVESLAKLPSLDELRARLVGIISTPAQRIAGVLKAPARQVAGVINAYSNKEE